MMFGCMKANASSVFILDTPAVFLAVTVIHITCKAALKFDIAIFTSEF
jgi:hypothetical protein